LTDSIGLRQQLLEALRGTVLLRVVSLASTFLGSVVLARSLGASAFGTYSFVFAVTTLLALPSQVGIPTLLVRETAAAEARREWARLKGLWGWATKVILLTSFVIALLAFATVILLPQSIDGELETTLIAGLLLVPLVALGSARSAALRGLRLIVKGQLPDSVIRPVLLIVFVFAYWQISGKVSASQAMFLHVGAAAIAFMVGAVMLWRARPDEIRDVHPDYSAASQWWRAAIPLAMISGLQVVSNQTGVVLLGILRSGADVALFKVATSAAILMTFGLQITNMIISPHVARLHAVQDKRRLARLAGLGALGGTAVSLPLFLVFVLAGESLLSLVYGAEYGSAFVPLVVLAGAQIINVAFGSTGVLLNMTGYERLAARWLAVSAGINILLSLILIPEFGVYGAAWASALSVVVWNVAFWTLARRKLGIDGSVFSVLRRRRDEKA